MLIGVDSSQDPLDGGSFQLLESVRLPLVITGGVRRQIIYASRGGAKEEVFGSSSSSSSSSLSLSLNEGDIF